VVHHRHRIPLLAATASVFCIAAPARWTSLAASRYAPIVAAGVLFAICITGREGGFSLSAGGEAPVVALLHQSRHGPQFLLSMDYEAGDAIAGWMASTDFDLILRWDRDGPWAGRLTAEVCGPFPVPVAIRNGDMALWSCGTRLALFEGLRWPISEQPMARR
jgi:hypothetical protein